MLRHSGHASRDHEVNASRCQRALQLEIERRKRMAYDSWSISEAADWQCSPGHSARSPPNLSRPKQGERGMSPSSRWAKMTYSRACGETWKTRPCGAHAYAPINNGHLSSPRAERCYWISTCTTTDSTARIITPSTRRTTCTSQVIDHIERASIDFI